MYGLKHVPVTPEFPSEDEEKTRFQFMQLFFSFHQLFENPTR